MSDTGTRARAKKRAKQAAAGKKPGRFGGAALPFDRSLAHLCWQIGLTHERTAWVMRRAVGEVRHEWSVLTQLPLDDDPTQEDIERQTAEFRADWTPETFEAAARLMRHDTSTKHRGETQCKATTNSQGIGKRKGPSPGCSRSTGLLPSSR